MYHVTGSNLFGQWMVKENIIDGFRDVSGKIYDNNSRIVHICWSYNIVQSNNEFYVIGAWHGLENQCQELIFPDECKHSCLAIVGNDYRLVVVNKTMNTIFSISLEQQHEVKRIKLDTEVPFEKEPKKQKKEDNILKVAACNDTFLFLTTEGVVYQSLLPTYVDTDHCTGKVVDVQCGYEHCILLTDTGDVYTWGNGRRLQLGHGDVNILDSPTIVEALGGIKITKIAAGGWHSFALSEFGDLYTWGWNDTGQLGILDKEKELKSCAVPSLVNIFEDGVEILKNVKDVACGSRHSAILLDDNTVWTTGNNKYGQLGLTMDKHPVVQSFKKSFHCKKETKLKCGLWSSVLITE